MPPKLAKELGGVGPIVICHRVNQVMSFIDPKNLRIFDIDTNTYWRHPFRPICNSKQLKEFTIMDIEVENNRPHSYGRESIKHTMADAWVMKTCDLTNNNQQQYHTKTHLGRLLNSGDKAMGFDFLNSNINDENLDNIKPENLPDVVLVKKVFGDKLTRHKKRTWKLNRLNIDKDGGASVATIDDKDYLDFLEDLEEDPKARENVNIYKDPRKMVNVEAEKTDQDDEMPKISLQEMLDDLHLQDDPMGDA